MSLLYVAVAALYGLAAWLRGRAVPVHALVGVALVLHAVTLVRTVATADGLDLSFAHALSLVAWLTVLVTMLSGLLRKLPAVGSVILPVAALCALAPLLGGSPHRFAYTGDVWASVHIAVALVAYALFVVAALQALLLAGFERRLHRGVARPADGPLPLLTLERFLFRLVIAGFVLLTLTLASGLVFSEHVFGRAVTFTHKNVFSVLGWAAFAVLVFGRWRYGWRGRRALYWIVGGTALLLLGYLGSKFVAQVLLGR
ncbi:MAG: cytochrome c biogenesis protein CcsA [Burkholderiales bacterium]|nr:cytochrome c biogenesis protein CcsA [Burkholderiales bacterium]